MFQPQPYAMSAGEVLRIFHRDAPYLFLGAAFAAVGLVSMAFAIVRRKHDVLLLYFALFASVYGLRLWIQSNLLQITIQGSVFFSRLTSAINYLILIPAFLFFTSLPFGGRPERITGYAIAVAGGALAAATLTFGDTSLFNLINNLVVLAGSGFLLVRLLRHSPPDGEDGKDFSAFRFGLMFFVALAVLVNLLGLMSIAPPRIEPFGFAVFLSCMGYVAARRTLRRDQQLNEIRSELEVARRIQLSILPAEFPASPHFQVAARYVPMTSVAGDFYDYILADGPEAGLLIADVSGHGVPAALIASMVKLAAASQRHVAADPARFLSGMNAALLGNTQSQLISAAYVHLNSHSREMRYSAAGHPPMLLLRNGAVIAIEGNGLLMGAFDFAAYANAVHPIEPGDRLVLYTDGIVEASNASGDFFGQAALSDLLRKSGGLSSSETADSIISSVRRWSLKQDDDLTVLICDYVSA
jgi:sigma-B regulation protein RsbU (phosphoserine phosphatase)